MKPILTVMLAFIVSASFALTKPEKTYQLTIMVGSIGYLKAQELLSKSYICLDASSAPHHDVNEAMGFMKQLSEPWQKEKVEQDKVKEAKK